MKNASTLFITLMSLSLTPAAFAQAALDETKVRDIIDLLTSNPRNAWISAGTIEGYHYEKLVKTSNEAKITAAIDKALRDYERKQETAQRKQPKELQENVRKAMPFNVRYRLANNYEMSAWERVSYDGERFSWEIRVDSRQDTVTPDADLAAKYVTDEFNMAWNQHRVFAWDGQEYTTYSSTPDGAGYRVVDAADELPHPVSGPLTAGLIPWGYGKFSPAELAGAEVSALDTGTAIEMTIVHADGTLTELSLDPSKGFAVNAATITGADAYSVTYTCSDYQSVGDTWVPSLITIERRNCGDENRAPTLEVWTDIRVDTSTASLGRFSAPLTPDMTVEYLSPVSASAVYVNSYEVDTAALLAERLAYAAGEGSRAQNCATAALRHVAAEFGKSVSNSDMAGLIGPNGRTSIADMERLAQDLGLDCRVVRTDVQTLRNLGTAKAILHLPSRSHFVTLDRADDRYVWLIDPSSNRFYYRESIESFSADWATGTALLLSDRPIAGRFAELPAAALGTMVGTGWSCTRFLQATDIVGCVIIGGWCQGAYEYYWERWGCEQAVSGTCVSQLMVRMQEIACVSDPIYECTVSGPWYFYYMRACQ